MNRSPNEAAAVIISLTLLGQMLNAVAVLIIACPCALGLATPSP